jgi:uncharacterized protein (DUF2141 family)
MQMLLFTFAMYMSFFSPWSKSDQKQELIVKVEGVRSVEGTVFVAVYDTEERYKSKDAAWLFDSPVSGKGEVLISGSVLPGNYALAVFHDRNNNGALDTNWLGIPSEGFGFSNNAMGRFGPPSFADCLIHVPDDKSVTVSIQLRHF